MKVAAMRILVVEDQKREREALARLLRAEGFHVVPASSAAQAIASREEDFDLVISDLRIGQECGIELLEKWVQNCPKTPFILMTAYGEVESAVTAMKMGAVDYLMKPLRPEELLKTIRRHSPPSMSAGPPFAEPTALGSMVGQSAAMLNVYERIHRVARSQSMVLITGESGTGKELVAQAIHQLSDRREQQFLAVNIAALPEGLVEGELFGYLKDSFTGATQDRKGRFEAADGGTLFIDEVGDFPLALQPKLLRVLESFCVCPVGAHFERPVNVRIVTATSRNLSELVAAGTFREDLFYRLNVLTIHLPPLRQRREDIPQLMDRFLKESAQRQHRVQPTLAPELIHFLTTYEWPGNVRQLRNAIENMVVMTHGDILTLCDLPPYFNAGRVAQVFGSGADGNLQDLERITILSALDRCQGNRTHAAELLGISVRTLQRKLKIWD